MAIVQNRQEVDDEYGDLGAPEDVQSTRATVQTQLESLRICRSRRKHSSTPPARPECAQLKPRIDRACTGGSE